MAEGAQVREGTPSQNGGCNFCTRPNHHNTVLVVTGDPDSPGCTVEARFCLPCMLGVLTSLNKESRNG